MWSRNSRRAIITNISARIAWGHEYLSYQVLCCTSAQIMSARCSMQLTNAQFSCCCCASGNGSSERGRAGAKSPSSPELSRNLPQSLTRRRIVCQNELQRQTKSVLEAASVLLLLKGICARVCRTSRQAPAGIRTFIIVFHP